MKIIFFHEYCFVKYSVSWINLYTNCRPNIIVQLSKRILA